MDLKAWQREVENYLHEVIRVPCLGSGLTLLPGSSAPHEGRQHQREHWKRDDGGLVLRGKSVSRSKWIIFRGKSTLMTPC